MLIFLKTFHKNYNILYQMLKKIDIILKIFSGSF